MRGLVLKKQRGFLKVKIRLNAGTIVFTVGIILAVIMGIGTAMQASWMAGKVTQWLLFVLVVMGLGVGFYNIKEKEVTPFLTGTVSLILASAVANLIAIDVLIPKVGTFIQATLGYFIVVVGAAAVVVSFKAVYGLAK
mgnify:CR=1 FL=1